MRIQDIRNMNPEELKKELDSTYKELMNLGFRRTTRQLSNTNEVLNVKKKIARIKTVMRERELAEA